MNQNVWIVQCVCSGGYHNVVAVFDNERLANDYVKDKKWRTYRWRINPWKVQSSLNKQEIIMTDSIKKDARSYVDVLNSPADGWGRHVCKITGCVSHDMLRIGSDRHGEINFQDAINLIFQEKDT